MTSGEVCLRRSLPDKWRCRARLRERCAELQAGADDQQSAKCTGAGYSVAEVLGSSFSPALIRLFLRPLRRPVLLHQLPPCLGLDRERAADPRVRHRF